MKAWTIIAWTFDADIHCCACTRKRFGPDVETADPAPEDSEANEIHPIFASDETDPSGEYCGDCGVEVAEPWPDDDDDDDDEQAAAGCPADTLCTASYPHDSDCGFCPCYHDESGASE